MRPIITWTVDERPVAKVVTCALCGGLRYAGSGPHSPHWVDGRQVDCSGRSIDAATRCESEGRP